MSNPTDFWCIACGEWMPVFVEVGPQAPNPTPYCNACGEEFFCDECGYVIDLAGDCQRPEGHDMEEGA